MDIEPTFKGYIEDEDDALLILQATLDGKLKHIPRRPYEIERPYLIVSGSIFVFIEEISGIKRWTDGVSWSPSRISGKFLIYKELDKENTNSNANITVNAGVTANANASSNSNSNASASANANATSSGNTDSSVIPNGTSGVRNNSSSKIKLPPLKNHQFDLPPTMNHSSFESEQDSSVSPSNRSNLPLKYTGLVKKTISVKLKRPPFNSIENLHIVSYYSVKDIKQNCLLTPKTSPFLKDIRPSQELIVAMENTTLGNVKNNSVTNGNSSNNINNKSNSSTPLNAVISTNNNSTNISAAGSNQFTSANKNYYYKNDESSGYPITQFAPALPSTTLMYTTNTPYITQSPDNTNNTGMNAHTNNNTNSNSNNNSNSSNNNINNNNNNNNNNFNNNTGNNNNPNRFPNGSFAYNTTGDFINPPQQGQISYPFYYTTIPISNSNYYTTQPPNPVANNSTNDNQSYPTPSTQHPYYGHSTENQSASATTGASGAPATTENVLPMSNMQPLLHQANNNANSASSAAPYPVYSMNVNVPYYNSSTSAYKRVQENTTTNSNAEPSGATSANSGAILSNPAYANSQQYTPSQVYYQGFPQYAMASAQNSSIYQHQHSLPTVYPITTSQQNIINSSHVLNTIGSDPQHHHYQQDANDHKNFAMGHSNNNILNITNSDTMNNLNTNASTTTQ
ncbi:hypothetical protein SMKI_05G0700 [Saccharomyces mikatae IFO 1815]|uniref:YEL007W-like protein n=1 Tax=Saccharomyces mikatae IFO 1815 TaxID=226126 RepID=A0AA35IWY7_SACMI|nr:uncharacterized protein SMKI_05G0700 [Saccharomyces mikatae IFO 1815]CAI4038459.1 hypothetical protein SMKI_05G0700 [Saccharomyces mikatae IFO 1815]